MWGGARKVTSAKQVLCPFAHPLNWSEKFWFTATFTAEERSNVSQDGVRHVKNDLKWPDSEYGGSETPREPSCVGQIPERLRNRFPSKLHRAFGHQDVDCLIGIPDIEIGIERPKHPGVVTNGQYDDARLARLVLRRPLHPVPNMTTDSAFVVE
jgi:hypothetical protein